MVDMGAEVGHKMRSAIKAKLTELDCYVDDELPDYIMVMVANKRTKTQMNEDLSLFLNTKTSTFVDWLHIVLKKLKEVTVTNLEVYKKANKRKSSELSSIKVKKEKRIKKEKLLKMDDDCNVKQEKDKIDKSLTDDLPLNVKSLSENRKILLVPNTLPNEIMVQKPDETFNIPSISEVDQSNLKELEEIENQIKSVKSRLGFKVDDDVEEAELRRLVENSRNKTRELSVEQANLENKFLNNGRQIELDTLRTIQVLPKEKYSIETGVVEPLDCMQKTLDQVGFTKKEHSRIIFSKNDFQCTPSSPARKKSVLDRLGKFSDNKEKTILDRLGKHSESIEWKALNERNNDGEHNSMGAPNSENKNDKGKDGGDYYDYHLEKTGRPYLPKGDEDISNTKAHHSRKEHLEKRDTNMFRNKDSSFRRSRDDLRKYLLKDAPFENLKKDLKKRLGLSSKVTVPQIDPQLLEDTFKKREVVSVVKVKPRILPPNLQQANKKLLLKAVADAQKSVAQSKPVGDLLKKDSTEKKYKTCGMSPSDALFTKQYKSNQKDCKVKRISPKEKEKLKCFLSSPKSFGGEFSQGKKGDQEYIPEAIRHSLNNVEYVPSIVDTKKHGASNSSLENKHKFIVTLDGFQKKETTKNISVRDRLHGRRTPSPIIYENAASNSIHLNTSPKVDKSKILDKITLVTVPTVKLKEKCKYFPLCRNGEDCEFYHPSRNCEQFPYCKFGEKCLYLHPVCKFGTSCTRRGCPYSHSSYSKQAPRSAIPSVPVKLQSQSNQTCKYFRNCININCSFYHPKLCKFGKYCKNQTVCNYSHSSVPNKSSLTWISK